MQIGDFLLHSRSWMRILSCQSSHQDVFSSLAFFFNCRRYILLSTKTNDIFLFWGLCWKKQIINFRILINLNEIFVSCHFKLFICFFQSACMFMETWTTYITWWRRRTIFSLKGIFILRVTFLLIWPIRLFMDSACSKW